jgi:hypothetical protein
MAIDLGEALRYPTNDEDWIVTVLIGGVLTLLSVFVVPAFLLYGYLLRVLRGGMDDDGVPPVFDDWGTLLREGVVAVVVLLVYQLVPLVIAAVTVGGSALAIASGSEAGAGVGIVGLLGGLAVSGLLALAFGYVALIGLANYARVGRFGAAFDFGTIRTVGLDADYAVAWLFGVGVLIAASVVTGVLSFVPIAGSIAGVFVGFYGQVVAGWLWGRGFGSATDGADPPGETAAFSEPQS